jgi:hypothetical protein
MLWLETGEIHGNNIGAFEWRRISKSTRVDQRCSAASASEQIVLPVQLRLGIAQGELIKALGVNVKEVVH